jgi:hypothetical protein
MDDNAVDSCMEDAGRWFICPWPSFNITRDLLAGIIISGDELNLSSLGEMLLLE